MAAVQVRTHSHLSIYFSIYHYLPYLSISSPFWPPSKYHTRCLCLASLSRYPFCCSHSPSSVVLTTAHVKWFYRYEDLVAEAVSNREERPSELSRTREVHCLELGHQLPRLPFLTAPVLFVVVGVPWRCGQEPFGPGACTLLLMGGADEA
jgi:hypothetical protein